MTAQEQEKQVKQQTAGLHWLDRLASQREKQPVNNGLVFLLVVLWEASDVLLQNAGYSILRWPGILFYAGILMFGILASFLFWLLLARTPSLVQALLFYGIGLGLWTMALWFTQSNELAWIVGIVFLFFLALEIWIWAFRCWKNLASITKAPDV